MAPEVVAYSDKMSDPAYKPPPTFSASVKVVKRGGGVYAGHYGKPSKIIWASFLSSLVGTITGLDYWTTGLDYWTGLLDSPKLQNTLIHSITFLAILYVFPVVSRGQRTQTYLMSFNNGLWNGLMEWTDGMD